MKLDQKALEALARAYDREDSAQRGEPDPWTDTDGSDDSQWQAERIACAEAGLSAYLSASAPADVAELLDELHNSRFGTWMAAINWCFRAADTISALSAKVEELTRERDEAHSRADKAENMHLPAATTAAIQGHMQCMSAFDEVHAKWLAAEASLAERDRIIAEKDRALLLIEDIMRRNYGRQDEKLADVEPIARAARDRRAS